MKRFGYLMLATSIGVLLAGCSVRIPRTVTLSAQPGSAEFSGNLSVSELGKSLKASELDVEYVLITQNIAGEETSGGVYVGDKDLSNLEAILRENTEGFIADMASTEGGGKFTTRLKQTKNGVSAPRITGITGNFSQIEVEKLNRKAKAKQ